ncbi:MAG: phosphatase PAP2 family protein [Bacteroidales bacterium]|nr:phosphatase PAP2 family protein [Bacteroidales bacterium]
MKKWWLLIFYVVVVLNILKAQSDSTETSVELNTSCGSYIKSYISDSRDIVRSLALSQPKEWLFYSGLGIGCAVSYKYEYEINDYFQKNQHKSISLFTQNVIDPYFGKELLGGVLIFTGVSAILKKNEATETGLNALKAGLLTGAIVFGAKMSIQRARPYMYETFPYKRNPFSDDFQSFPSGHSANAFSIATVFSEAYKDEYRAVPYICYSLAGLIAISRVYDNKHHISDIITGSAIGYFVGRLVSHKKNWHKSYKQKIKVL